MTKIRLSLTASAVAVLLAGCNATGSEAAGAAAGLDPTGVSSFAMSMAPSGQDDDDEAGSGEVDFSRIAPRLRDVAAGQTARPSMGSMLDDQMNAMARQQALSLAMSVANIAISGALTGGAGLVAAAPGLAMQAAGSGMATAQMMAARSQVQGSIAEAERQREAARVVPDEDRPAEARAILSLLNGAKGRSASWSNPATGASGTVTLQSNRGQPVQGIQCRFITQVWRSNGQERKGGMGVCKSRGEWYDLS